MSEDLMFSLWHTRNQATYKDTIPLEVVLFLFTGAKAASRPGPHRRGFTITLQTHHTG